MPRVTPRPFLAAVITVALIGTVAGCAHDATASASATASSSTASASTSARVTLDPQKLIGTWIVTNTGTAADGTTVALDWPQAYRGEATITADCGTIRGEWAANKIGEFIGKVTEWTTSCDNDSDGDTESGQPVQLIAWLSTATAYTYPTTTQATTVELSNSAGANIATLVELQGSSGSARASASADPSASASASASASTSPSSAVTVSEVVGKWVQAHRPQEAPTPPFLQFTSDGTWSGSDGCNSGAGRWLLTDDGGILATSGPTTLITCTGMVDLGRALVQARSITVRNDSLYLWDANGALIVRLVPEQASTSETPRASVTASASPSPSASE